MNRSPALGLTGILVLVATAAAPAQTATVDEGTFRITIGEATAGTETFTIQRNGAGANATTVVQGRVIMDTGERITTALELQGPQFQPSAYRIQVEGPERQNITARAAGNRFRATIVSGDGEQMREFLVDDGAVILDDGIAHHHFFLAAAVDEDPRVPVVLPRQNRQTTATVQDHGSETIRLPDRTVTARRLDIRIRDAADRTVWVDDQNRVLRIQVPDLDLEATRTTLP